MQIVKEEIESVLDEEYKCGPKKCTYIAPRTYYIPDDSLQLEPFPLVGQAKRYDPDKGEYVAANVRRSETSTGIDADKTVRQPRRGPEGVKESNMKLTKTKLMQIIQEEIEALLQENEKVRSAAAEVSPHAKRIGGVPDAATLLAKALDDTNLPDDNAKMAAADLTLTTLAQRQDDQSAEVQRAQKAQG